MSRAKKPRNVSYLTSYLTTADFKALARRFHEVYEVLAPGFGWSTQEASRVTWDELPTNQRDLMVATIRKIFEKEVIGMIKALEEDKLVSGWPICISDAPVRCGHCGCPLVGSGDGPLWVLTEAIATHIDVCQIPTIGGTDV